MPLFEYECTKCGNRFEKIQKFSDPKTRTCPKCKGKAKRLASAPAIQFKGTGWYITDYARKGEKSSDDKAVKSSDEKGAKGGEDKPSKEKDKKPAKSSTSKKGSGD
ncbi:MAG TPA: FmdB family zinc ribbon protein [Candidatus Polarisedimenticolia bacterium]|nr:FmdB family zinc ribbon protein [Candidatus Polarisedimenticolia bacterium]